MVNMNTNTAYENLAKLMSTENIGVTYGNVETAYFNVETRTLMIPNWEGLSEIESSLLIAHEIGHALYTPSDSWKSAIDEMGPNFKGYLNIVEDARIEKAVKTKFPGTKQIFYFGYQKLSERANIFPKDLSIYTFVDIINAHYKLMGPILGIKLNEAHRYFIDKIDNIVSFDDAVTVAKELFEYSKGQGLHDEENLNKETRRTTSSNTTEVNTNNTSSKLEEPSEKDNSRNDSFDNEYDNSEENKSEKNEEAPESITADSIADALRSNLPKNNIFVADIPDPILKNIIVPFKTIIEKASGKIQRPIDPKNEDEEFLSPEELEDLIEKTSLTTFTKNNASKIAYHKQLFEMRKKALEHKRTLTFRSGILNTNKIHAYKYDDQIFKTFEVKESGKKHGLIFFLDMSGSMASYISGAISKLLEIVLFCKSSEIPFLVYGFTTAYSELLHPHGYKQENYNKFENYGQMEYRMSLSYDFNLLEFLSSEMTNVEFKKGVDILLDRVGNRRNHYGMFGLGGTPLNETILCLSSLVKNFKNNTNAKIVNCVFFTDGAGHEYGFIKNVKNDSQHIYGHGIDSYSKNKYFLYDSKKKKNYLINESNELDLSKILLEVMKNRIPDTNIVNFNIVTSLSNEITDKEIKDNYPTAPNRLLSQYNWQDRQNLENIITNNPIILIRNNNRGFDQVYYLTSGCLAKPNNKKNKIVSSKVDITDVKENFISSSKNKKEMNKLISAFVDMIV